MRRVPRILAVLVLLLAATAVVAPAAAAEPPAPLPCPGCYLPAVRTSWQIQLDGTITTKVDAALYDVDLFETPAAKLATLHAQGRKVACYFSAGSFESFRPDAAAYPAAVVGKSNGWPGERWVDIRRLDVLGPIIEARLDLCRARGFDSADADNVDGFTNDTGFPLTAADQLTFNAFVANAAHARGLSIALKNDLDQIPQLVDYFDWAVNEQCQQYRECDLLLPFVQHGKPVMQIEYALPKQSFCPQANAHDFNGLRKRLDLKAWRVACR
jgi:hypothetical protein